MKSPRTWSALLGGALLALGLSFGAVSTPAEAANAGDRDSSQDDDSNVDTVSGKKVLRGGSTKDGEAKPQPKPTVTSAEQAAFQKKLEKYEGRELPAIAYLGGEMLSVPPEFIQECQDGLDKIFLRDYKGAKKQFDQMSVTYRGWGVGPVGQVLVWQALMLENFDFKYESQYQVSHKRARMELEEALQTPGNDAWENFLMAGILGIESIHLMRQEEFVKALNRGYEAMKAVKRTQEIAPEFVDINLGDGLFNYWVSVISQQTKLIPDMGDKREQGIRQQLLVEQQAIFLGPPATLALTFTYIEEGRKKDALRSGLKNYRRYPDNIINNQVLGRVYMYNRMYEDSERIFKHVLATDPKNQRAHYYIARLYLRTGKLKMCGNHLDQYLAFTDLDNNQRASALYFYGKLEQRRKHPDLAEKYYKEAWKIAKYKPAKNRLDRMAERKKKKKK